MAIDAADHSSLKSAKRSSPSDSPVDEDSQTYALIGLGMEVHRTLGNGFLERIYQDAFERELIEKAIPYQREHPIPISYKGKLLGTPYRADFLCFESVIVELKAIHGLSTLEDAQVIHYLKASGLKRAILLNFGSRRLGYKRLVYEL